MERDELFRSGVPVAIATISMLALAYVAGIRREKLAIFWTSAWALLVARYAWVGFWGSPYPNEAAALVGAMLRVAFAMTVLLGVLALRGARVALWWIPAVAVTVPLVLRLLPVLSESQRALGTLVVMCGVLLTSAMLLATASTLPRFERLVVAASLATYACASGVVSSLVTGSDAFTRLTFIAWSAQLMVGLGILATFFRLSYEAELTSRALVESRLTQALSGFVHICMHCKAVRNEQHAWQPLERFIGERTSAQLSHGLCNSCAERHYPDDFTPASAANA